MIFDASSLYILLKRKELRTLRDSSTLDLAFYEVGNSLLKELRRKLITSQTFTGMLNVLGGIGEVMVVRNFRELDVEKVSEVSMSAGLTFYDGAYLTLALASRDTLVTNDEYLREKARKIGVRTLSV